MKEEHLNILQLSPQVPYPLTDGGKVGIYNITKHLAIRGHRVTMLALDRTPGVDAGPLEKFCTLLRVPHSNKNSIIGACVNLFSDESYNISKYRSGAFERALAELLSRQSFDVVHADHLHMARYGLWCKQRHGLPFILREHNIESIIVERFAENAHPAPLRWWGALQARRIRAYEGRLAGESDACCAITEEDRSRLLRLAPGARVSVIPAGVDEAYFTPEVYPEGAKLPGSIAMFGSFDWLPNQDALVWFVRTIFPKIRRRRPDAKLTIMGKEVPESIRALGGADVTVRGFVPDLKNELQRHLLTVVPLRMGGGMRLKIVESFAMRVPVVSTTIGCEGIACRAGEHLLVADGEDAFADKVVELLNEPLQRARLAEAAFRLASEKYRWESAARRLEEVYRTLLASAGRADNAGDAA